MQFSGKLLYFVGQIAIIGAVMQRTFAFSTEMVAAASERFPKIVLTSHCSIINRDQVTVSVTVVQQGSCIMGTAEAGVRGSSSARHPKKPYRLEFQDQAGDDLKLSLLGMPKESD